MHLVAQLGVFGRHVGGRREQIAAGALHPELLTDADAFPWNITPRSAVKPQPALAGASALPQPRPT
jgi:hypothetical protein